jgi:hypothetical protein
MGFLDRLLGRNTNVPANQVTAPRSPRPILLGTNFTDPDECNVEVVGESHYVPGIEAALLKGFTRIPRSGEYFTQAELVREPNNPHDGYAVAVHIAGRQVGYMGAGVLKLPQLQIVADNQVVVGARIGWGQPPYYGVRLHRSLLGLSQP